MSMIKYLINRKWGSSIIEENLEKRELIKSILEISGEIPIPIK